MATNKRSSAAPADLPQDLLTTIPEEERESFIQQFNSMQFFRAHMVLYMKKELEKAVVASENTERYKDASWAMQQADSVGYRRACRKLIRAFGGDETIRYLEE